MNNIFKRINFRQPKYMLPAILYIPLLGTSYFIFDLFHTEKARGTRTRHSRRPSS